MKRSVLKGLSVIAIVLVLMFSSISVAFAETIQDRLENYISGAVDDFENAESAEDQESIQEQLDSWLAENGLDSIDLSTITDSDIGSIVSGLIGDSGSSGGSILDSLSGVGDLITGAFNSGLGMITDAIGGGFGTSDGSNTATTEPVTSPNIIIADDTTKESATQAVGVPNVQAPATQVAPTTEPSTSEVTTYNVGSAVSGDLIGSGVTTTAVADTNSVVKDDNTSAVTVLVILSVSTLVIIVTMVAFFLMKRKY